MDRREHSMSVERWSVDVGVTTKGNGGFRIANLCVRAIERVPVSARFVFKRETGTFEIAEQLSPVTFAWVK
jgi:hypothetical protein